jgi:hypothetical protein
MNAEVVDLSARRRQIPITAPAEDDPSDVRAQNLADRARAIVAAKNLQLPELKHRAWGRRASVGC